MPTTANDLKIYYSGAKVYNELQGDPLLSLGNYKSQALVPNDTLNNLFGSLGCYELKEGNQNTIALFLVNESADTDMLNLSLYITGKQDFETIEFGVSAPASLESPVQTLSSPLAKPFNVQFVEAYEVGDAVDFGTLAFGEALVLWVTRVFPEDSTEDDDSGNIQLVFDWT